MSLILQSRDKNILDALNRFGVLSTNQIAELFFCSVAHTTMMRRIRLLKSENWIRSCASLANAENTFTLGSKANVLYPGRESNHFSNRSTIGHDVMLSSLRLRLESLGLAKTWTPEFEIRAKALRNQWRSRDDIVIPDGLWIESINGEFKAIAVELELTVKSRSRYKEIFKRHFIYSRNTHFIYYIVQSVNDANRILIAARSSGYLRPEQLWFSVLDSILKDADPGIWSVEKGKMLKFSEIGFNEFKPNLKRTNSQILPAQGVSSVSDEKMESTEAPQVPDLKKVFYEKAS